MSPNVARPVAIYARVSTDDQSCALQIERLSAYCRATGLGDPVTFADEGVSGIRDNRPRLDELRRRMNAGEFRTVVVSKIDRLGRSVQMVLRFWDEADALKVRVVVVDQAIDTSTAAGRLQRTMLAAIAEFERELIKERTDAGIERARAAGKKFGRPRVIPAEKVQDVLALFQSGVPLRQIAMRTGVKLGGVRSVLRRRDQSPPLQTEGSGSGATRAA